MGQYSKQFNLFGRMEMLEAKQNFTSLVCPFVQDLFGLENNIIDSGSFSHKEKVLCSDASVD